MLIESHAHYSHKSFDAEFPYLRLDGEENIEIVRGRREDVLIQLQSKGFMCFIEPAISLESNEIIDEMSEKYPGFMYKAVGVHPTRTCVPLLSSRRKLDAYILRPQVAAIGETGLDYHFSRPEQHRLSQFMWFLYQLQLGKRYALPFIFHIRLADRAAIRILKLRKSCLGRGGVVHCFNGGKETAEEYLKLGLHIGLGGAVLQPQEKAAELCEAVKAIPLERIIIETDSPYVKPGTGGQYSKNTLRKARNTSLIFPLIINRIAEIKGISPSTVEEVCTENAARLFRLPFSGSSELSIESN